MADTSEPVALPLGSLHTIDRLRGTSSRSEWLAEAALRLAHQQAGHDPQDPIGGHDLGSGLSMPTTSKPPRAHKNSRKN